MLTHVPATALRCTKRCMMRQGFEMDSAQVHGNAPVAAAYLLRAGMHWKSLEALKIIGSTETDTWAQVGVLEVGDVVRRIQRRMNEASIWRCKFITQKGDIAW